MFYIFLFGLCCFALASVAWHRRRSQFVFRADQQLMASTSTQLQQDGAFLPSGSISWKYDVFLSFRGTDTRNGFVDHLYSALHEKVIFTFKDDQRLERGESISPALLKAIEESRFAVVVFSENYASSKWCLEELVKILACKEEGALTVLTVFYKVDPSHLRKQTGSVGEAFAQHERDSSEEEVQRWRNALTEVASISGWDSKTHRAEAKLIRDIAIDILNRLGYNGSNDLEDVVGLLPRVAEVMSKLEMGLDLDDPRVVGIYGMGGIGKTTIAKAVYHQIRTRFQASCYLPNVREAADGKHGLESLQKSLLVDIHSVSDSDIKIRNIDWLGAIRNAIGNKKVLVVLDDVDHLDQLNGLAGKLDWFGPGSRIIITTRNDHLLARYGPRRSHVYNVEGLNYEDASRLFCCKAFWDNQPTPGFEHLIKSAVDYAKGVPLALNVLGCFLIDREVNEWQSAIRRLRQEPHPDIQKVLKLSYDGLGREEKKIFLDIACFFKWYSMEYSIVVNILNACGFQANIGVRVLKDKALVTIRDNMIDMHDLIQDMGWHIVKEESPDEPGRRSRLCKCEDIYHTLTKKTGTEAVETIILHSYGTKKISLSPDTFSKMIKLRLLQLSNVQLPNGLDYLSNDLRLLDWHRYPLKFLPSNFQPDSLVTLKMSNSRLEQPWNGRMCLDELKYVDLSFSPYITKNLDFTHVTNLKRLVLEGCTNIVEISSIEAIKGLAFLNLKGLNHLKVLPTGCWLKSLEGLYLSGCSKLKNVSDVLASTKCLIYLELDGTCVVELPVEHLSNLIFISLKDCKELTSLRICGLKLLITLDVSGCSKLSKLPENIGGLESLCNLRAKCTAIKQLPSSIIHLKNLRSLGLSQCRGPITSTPDDLGSLSLLVDLDLSGSSIISLPASIRDLYELMHLVLVDCKKLKTLPYLPINIKYINVGGCTSLETFPDPAILPRKLGTANFSNCHTLIKNRPSLPFELVRNSLKQVVPTDRYCYIAVPGREIPKCFSNQNNMGHYVGIQLMPDRYQRLNGFVICVVFEATAPSIDADAECDVICFVMWNDDEVKRMTFTTYISQFQPYYLFLHYIPFQRRGYLDEELMKNEIIFYFRVDEEWSKDPEVIAPVKCAVHAVYENDEEWPDPHSSIQLSDCDDEYGSTERTQGVVSKKRSCHNHDYKADAREQSNPKRLRDDVVQGRDSQSELLEISLENIINSKMKEGYGGEGCHIYF
ncbi:disease resistance protein RPV1-like isoform X6 [Diospyros lotus]|uniref:disease resistance protein RPV1-like isoform X6 n=1 Tax=Diospyros lotus TaxID=55363 RepID=UPI00224CF6D9|nr:disease resistance protein RPV1-like isoform X6 [Diospyros lotus]